MKKKIVSQDLKENINEFLYRIKYSTANNYYVYLDKQTEEICISFESTNMRALSDLIHNDTTSPYWDNYLTCNFNGKNIDDDTELKQEVAKRTFVVTKNSFTCSSDVKDEKTDFSAKWDNYITEILDNGYYTKRLV